MVLVWSLYYLSMNHLIIALFVRSNRQSGAPLRSEATHATSDRVAPVQRRRGSHLGAFQCIGAKRNENTGSRRMFAVGLPRCVWFGRDRWSKWRSASVELEVP